MKSNSIAVRKLGKRAEGILRAVVFSGRGSVAPRMLPLFLRNAASTGKGDAVKDERN